MTKIAVFSSGQGSTFNHLIQHFKANPAKASVNLLITDREQTPSINFAKKNNIPFVIAKKSNFNTANELQDHILQKLKEYKIDFIILAGYLKKIGDVITNSYVNKIINTHPSLLPKYGGKGMYGTHVHKAVIHNQESKTGATIHYVTNEYDKGQIIAQKSFAIANEDTYLTIEQKVKSLEKQLLTNTLEEIL